jgi:signal transduction histidine kinase
MRTKRRWGLVGLLAGVVMGLGDLALFSVLGVEMRIGGHDVVGGVMGLFIATYGVLGWVMGRLVEARERAAADARTITAQLHALAASQRALMQSEKLAAIGRLAAGVAHEVRNPLGVIRASASMLEDGPALDDDARRACRFIREEIDRLNGLITSLLAFARPTEPRLCPVAMDAVIDRALRLAGPEVDRRAIALVRETPPALPDVRADPDLLAQVLLGLLVNATEAVAEHGRIVVRAGVDGAAVTVEVADDGPGVAPGNVEQVFEPFFTTKASGTGLGLAMALRIAHAHGGTLELAPGCGAGASGAGACFRLRLPREHGDAPIRSAA